MSQAILSKQTQSNLEALREKKLLNDFYLAGGTGLALQLKHRKSIDLDFFTQDGIDTNFLIQALKKRGDIAVKNEAKNTLEVDFQGTKITFLSYEYPLLYDLREIKGMKVADFRDIGCMKISAISSRGSKKDFVDVFFIAKEIELSSLLSLFRKKYADVDYSGLHIFKSLTYFEQAEPEPMPNMIQEVNWEQVKEFFKREVKKISFDF